MKWNLCFFTIHFSPCFLFSCGPSKLPWTTFYSLRVEVKEELFRFTCLTFPRFFSYASLFQICFSHALLFQGFFKLPHFSKFFFSHASFFQVFLRMPHFSKVFSHASLFQVFFFNASLFQGGLPGSIVSVIIIVIFHNLCQRTSFLDENFHLIHFWIVVMSLCRHILHFFCKSIQFAIWDICAFLSKAANLKDDFFNDS